MPLSRLLLPLLFAFSLLLAQQAGIAHTLQHTLAGHQQDKQTPHNHNCEQCAQDAQFGSALNSASHSIAIIDSSSESLLQHTFSFRSIPVFAAAARGPPAFQQFA